MSSRTLTDLLVRKVPIPSKAEGQREIWDAILRGFGLRLNPGGRKTFMVMTRVYGTGKQRRITVGTYPALSVKDARKRAAEIIAQAQSGIDPRLELEKLKREQDQSALKEKRRRRRTFEKVVDQYIEEYAKVHAPRTWKESQRILQREPLAAWRNRPLDDINRDDVKYLLKKKAKKAPIAANRYFEVLRTLFYWSMDEGLLLGAVSPMHRMTKPSPETERERVLSDDEIKAIWRVCDEHLKYPYGAMVQLFFTTGQRRTEVAGMHWSEIDIKAATWDIPGARAKGGKGHKAPLSPLAVSILVGLPVLVDADGKKYRHVLASGIRGDKAPSNYSKTKADLDRLSKVTDWRFHDIRRTVATKMRGLEIDRLTVSKVLNHSESGITRIYDRYSENKEKKQALERWGAELTRIIEGKHKVKVVAFR